MRIRESIPAATGGPARHTRQRDTFEETFGTPARTAIEAMNRHGDDVPSQVPATPIPLQRMGLRREAIPVLIADPFDPAGRVQIACEVDAHVELRPEQRGIHVSRIGDVLARLAGTTFPSLDRYAFAVAEQVRAAQGCRTAEVRVGGTLSYLERVEGVKDKSSIEHLVLGAHARLGEATAERSSSLTIHHITACPCVQQTFKHSLPHEAREPVAAAGIPLLTHSQRCRTTITIADGEGDLPPVIDLLEAVDATVVRSQNTLPREFELLNVHRAHARPQFLEDVLRDLMRAVHRLVCDAAPERTITIESTSMESIHDFDISGRLSCTVAELNALAAQP